VLCEHAFRRCQAEQTFRIPGALLRRYREHPDLSKPELKDQLLREHFRPGGISVLDICNLDVETLRCFAPLLTAFTTSPCLPTNAN